MIIITRNKAQTGVELIVILAIALAVLLIILSINDDVFVSISNRFDVDKAKSSLEDLANAAEIIYQQGAGAKTKVYITIPKAVYATSVSDRTLSIKLYSGENIRDVYRTVDFDIIGNIPQVEGNHWVGIEAFDNYVNIGGVAITCPDSVCSEGENCNLDSSACTDNICYEPTCINGCGQTAIINVQDSGECDSSTGCASPPCICDGSSNCISILTICGNNIREGTEICDGSDLAGQTCQSLGYSGGILSCLGDCSAFDTNGCTMVVACQQACLNLGFSQWSCRANCGGSWKNPAPQGNAYCIQNSLGAACCCR